MAGDFETTSAISEPVIISLDTKQALNMIVAAVRRYIYKKNF
jgi:hypothetical protein